MKARSAGIAQHLLCQFEPMHVVITYQFSMTWHNVMLQGDKNKAILTGYVAPAWVALLAAAKEKAATPADFYKYANKSSSGLALRNAALWLTICVPRTLPAH